MADQFTFLALGCGFEVGRAAYGATLRLLGTPAEGRLAATEFLFSLAVMEGLAILPVRLLQGWLSNSGC